MTCQIQWHFTFNESLNKCIKKANANTLSDTSKLVPSKSSIFTDFIKITKNIQKGSGVIGNGRMYFRQEVEVMPNDKKKTSCPNLPTLQIYSISFLHFLRVSHFPLYWTVYI